MHLTFESSGFAFHYATRPWLVVDRGVSVSPAGLAIRLGWRVFARRCGVGPLQWFDTREPFDEATHKLKYAAEYKAAHQLSRA